MKKLLLLILLISIIAMPNVYSAPTEYDEEQDDLIEDNADDISDNADDIADIADNFVDNAENIATNANDISDNADDIATNTSNISSNDTDIATNQTNITTNTNGISTMNKAIGDRNYSTYYITSGESVTSSIESLDQQVFINRTDINNNSQRLNDHEGRIGDLEEKEINLVGEVQFIREKNHTVSSYVKYDTRHNRIPEVGLKLTVGLGKSWTQKELERLELKLNKIEKLLQRVAGKREPIETKMIKTENGYSIVIDEEDTAKLLKKF